MGLGGRGVRTAGRTAAQRGPTEKSFQAQVEHYARLMGWKVFHPWLSVRSTPGWPDLVMVKDGRMIVAELKSLTGKTSPAQDEWLAALRAVPGVAVYVWRPTDTCWLLIERVLGRAT